MLLQASPTAAGLSSSLATLDLHTHTAGEWEGKGKEEKSNVKSSHLTQITRFRETPSDTVHFLCMNPANSYAIMRGGDLHCLGGG